MNNSLKIKLAHQNAKAPVRQHDDDAGYDLFACEDVVIPSHGWGLVPTGICMMVPRGTYGRVAPRSGLAYKKGIDVGAGVIDWGYRGTVGVILFNHSAENFEVKPGDRIAQLILEKIETPEVEVVEDLEETERGGGGFGSTGKN